MNVLVLTYWSYKEPLIQAATLPFLSMIRKVNPEGRIYLLTLEKDELALSESELAAAREKLDKENIELINLRYRRFGVPAMVVWLKELFSLRQMCKRAGIDVIHAFGSPVGSIAYMLSKLTGIRLVIDSYEPHAESMVENGSWSKSSSAFKLLFSFEKKLAHHAYAVLGTTQGMQDYARKTYGIAPRRFIYKPACVDLDQFNPENFDRERLRANLGYSDHIVCVYAGKLGGIYLREDIFHFFAACEKFWGDRFRVILLTDAPIDEVSRLCASTHFSEEKLLRKTADHDEVASYLSCADFAINPVKPVPSKRYCTSIKDGEYWAMGLPVVIPPNISDDSDLIASREIGVVLEDWKTPRSALDAIGKLIDESANNKEKIRALAVQNRSMAIAEAGYDKLYGLSGIFNKPEKRFLAVIYNSYGDPLFQNLIFQYIQPLTAKNWNYTLDLVTFEQEKYEIPPAETKTLQSALAEKGVVWHPLDYHSGSLILLKKVYDFFAALILTTRLKIKRNPNLIVSMGNTSAAITVKLSRLLNIDMMAYSFEPHSEFMADFGIWERTGWKFRILKALEDEAARHSKYILTGTRHMVQELEGKTSAEVFRAPSCADEDIFNFDLTSRTEIRNRLNIEDRKVLVYAGKFGGIYYDQEIAHFYKALLTNNPDWFFLILSPSDHEEITTWFETAGLEPSSYHITEAKSPAEVASYLSASDMGLSAIPPLPSQRFRSPIKVGEYLMCGLPFITCKGISEDDLYALENNVGIVIDEIDEKFAARVNAEAMVFFEENEHALRQRCRSTGIEYRGKDQLHSLFAELWSRPI